MRTAQYFYGILKLQTKQVWHKFVEKGFVTYVIALLPFNLIFGNNTFFYESLNIDDRNC